jgi:hypothetical protein
MSKHGRFCVITLFLGTLLSVLAEYRIETRELLEANSRLIRLIEDQGWKRAPQCSGIKEDCLEREGCQSESR